MVVRRVGLVGNAHVSRVTGGARTDRAYQRHRLDEVSAPQLGFPVVANRTAPMLAFGGTTVDGQAWDEFPTLASSSNRY